jgi:hypothetical protein
MAAWRRHKGYGADYSLQLTGKIADFVCNLARCGNHIAGRMVEQHATNTINQ